LIALLSFEESNKLNKLSFSDSEKLLSFDKFSFSDKLLSNRLYILSIIISAAFIAVNASPLKNKTK